MFGNTKHLLVNEDRECIRDWDNFVMLGKLPHELGYTDEPCHEDTEAIKQMKRWLEQRQKREEKKQDAVARLKEKAQKEGAFS